MNNLQRFAYNQARFVFSTMRTVERELMCNGIQEEKTFEKIKQTENGKKYLSNVTFEEIKQEGRSPGLFMHLNTDLGHYVSDEDWDRYVDNFEEE